MCFTHLRPPPRLPSSRRHQKQFATQPTNQPINQRITLGAAIATIEKDFLAYADREKLQDGTTAVIAVVIGDALYAANVGDSEMFVSREGTPLALTCIHNPMKNDDEVARVRDTGGRLHNRRVGHPYFNASIFNIAISRAMSVLPLPSLLPPPPPPLYLPFACSLCLFV
jgi:serine/threonine protein phosphatase PrpC